MNYRPYPNVDRALRQLDRHIVPLPPREPSGFELRLAQQATAALNAMRASLHPYYEAMKRMSAAGVPTPR